MSDMRSLLYRETGQFRVVQKGADGKPIEKEIPFDGLSLTDTAGLEALWNVGSGTFLDALRDSTTVIRMLQVIWFAVRKHGKSREELDAGKYALSMGEVGDLFSAGGVAQLWGAFQAVFERSGYVFTPRPMAEPPKGQPAPAAAAEPAASDTPKAGA